MAERRILNSWKEIAGYLGRGVRTVQRWEAQLGLPVHRPAGKEHSAVLAFSSELDEWLDSRPLRQPALAEVATQTAADPKTLELQALVFRAEAILQKIDTLLLRTDEAHRKLFELVDGLAADSNRDLRTTQRTRRVEAGAA
jgi:hypothetical protein